MFRAPNLWHENLLSLLNVKYVVSPTLPEDISRYDEGTQRTLQGLRDFLSQPWASRVLEGRRYSVYENKECLPRAFLVPAHEVISDDEQILAMLKGDDFDPKETVILEKEPGVLSVRAGVPSGQVRVLHYSPNSILLEASLTHPAWLVLSENYHPHWRATVDGKTAQVHRADFVLRAVHLAEGRHTVEFVYDSPLFRAGAAISSLTLLFLLGTIVHWFRRR